MKIMCVDGNSVFNRAFYAIKMLTTKDGRYTNAIYGFMNILLKLQNQYKPDAVAIAFDLPGKTFRHDRYDQYKATRKGMPPEMAEQMEPLKELLTDLGYRIVTAEGYEADDILGTFAKQCSGMEETCYIATGDRDTLQLIDDYVRVLLTTTQFGRGETAEMDAAAVHEKYGVEPRQLIDVKGLMGDSSDNIPGVPGVGEKTALMLIQKFGTLDNVYENLDDEAIKPGARQKLMDNKELAYLSRELATICTDVPVDTNSALYIQTAGDPAAAAALLGDLEMHSFIERLGLEGVAAGQRTQEQEETEAVALLPLTDQDLDGAPRLYLYADEKGYYATVAGQGYLLDKTTLKMALTSDKEIYCYDSKRLYHAALDGGYSVHGIVFDLKLAAYLLDPGSAGYAPEMLANEYRVQPVFSSEEPSLGLMEPLCEKLAAALEEQGMRKLHDDIELPLSAVLADMEHEGFLLDAAGLRAFGKELEQQIEHEQEKVFELVGYRFNLNSPKQLGKALFEDLELPVGKKTKSGYSTNAETLEKLRGAHPVIDHILEYRTHQKLNSTYVEGLLKAVDAGGRIHTEFNQTETRTGRISSREPNLQNIPVRTELGSRFREFFIASPGRELLDADYSQIELRVLASISGDERMAEAFRHDRDIHTETASEIFKVPRDQVTPELRRRAKAVNFGIVYGIGAFSLAQDTGVSVKEAGSYIDGYLATYSGVAHYLEETVADAERDGYVTTLYGRRRALPELASSNRQIAALGKRLAMNTPIQGTAADIIKIAMIKVHKRLLDEGLDAKLTLQVHDELIIESAEKDSDRASVLLKEEMERAADLNVPLEVEVGKGRNWYEAK